MSTNKTKNMNMNSWGSKDTVLREELNANFDAIDKEFADRGGSILWRGGSGNGTAGNYNALLSAVNSDINTIYFPKGTYLVEKNITIPVAKRLTFDRGARIKPAKGVTITVNGAVDAGVYDWVFDISAGGVIAGTPLTADIYPHWFGAKGDGVTDDSAAFQAAMLICNKKYRIFLPQGTYRIRQTIENQSRGMYGVGDYVDGGQLGSQIMWDPIDTKTDLLPCIRIEQAGLDAVFENFSVIGEILYNPRQLSTWVNKSLFDQDLYSMFSAGPAAFEVAGGAKPIFRCVRTNQVKVGLLMNSTDGHITAYDCTWSGLIGVYCLKNSEDYFFQGGAISGAFCCIMFGIAEHANHYGGFGATMKRVHLGYAPYGVYQVKDSNTYDNASGGVNGLYGSFQSVRFEQVGEAAIKLLPKSISNGLLMSGLGMSWSSIDPTANEYTALPDSLKSPGEKQQYAVVLGYVTTTVIEGFEGLAVKSSAPGAKGSAYIDYIEKNVIVSGLNPEFLTIKNKNIRTSLLYTSPLTVGESIRAKANSAVSHGNLLKNPETASSWSVTAGTGTSLSVVSDLSKLPVPFSAEMKAYIDQSVGAVLKITPNGSSSPYISLGFSSSSIETNRFLSFEYFILSPVSRYRSRLDFGSHATLYDDTFEVTTNGWSKISCREQLAPNSIGISASFFDLSAAQPTYIAAVMVNYDFNGAYSPYNHAYSKKAIESGDAFILTDKTTGTRNKIEIVGGKLQITALS
ncbi:glycosyl hydrolase family 28-related protein [Paenibacillus sp. NPDC058071]|uniref:glycosyl hydrolase family 28-related protein n=1 Tax=Paenibacillus sp. NPDC058071 TaxID=3346326 RepID=UPI0036DB242E